MYIHTRGSTKCYYICRELDAGKLVAFMCVSILCILRVYSASYTNWTRGSSGRRDLSDYTTSNLLTRSISTFPVYSPLS